jgi:hypothetical protein
MGQGPQRSLCGLIEKARQQCHDRRIVDRPDRAAADRAEGPR